MMGALRMPIQIDTSKKGAIAQFIKDKVEEGATLYLPSSIFTIYAFNELKDVIKKSNKVKFLFNKPTFIKKIRTDEKNVKEFQLQMTDREKSVSEFALEISMKNNLDQNSVANQCYLLLEDKMEVRSVTENNFFNSNCLLIDNETGDKYLLQSMNFEFSMAGLGYTDQRKFDFAYALDDRSSIDSYRELFDEIWNNKDSVEDVKEELLRYISNLYKENSPELAYYITLYNLFSDKIINDDDYAAIKENTGITQTKVWNMLYNFQQDAVVGAVHKIQKYDGCIIADSVGLGKTFEALAIIKYYELRNERVLVLCPKKLRANWIGFKQNSSTNPLVDDKFRYDVLNHTDLSRSRGMTGDIDLSKINWGNYDLVVIDESHAFRNNPPRNDRVTRYARLMDSIIKSGVKTKVLMLSATPVNNRLSDLKNQINFITAGADDAMAKRGKNVPSIEITLTNAQREFNRWSNTPAKERKSENLINVLDYFHILNYILFDDKY
jgi:SNF2 family DNA or RNA helicase